MPGVGYLEMARAATAQAIRKTKQEEGHMLPVEQVHRLRHIAWVRPLVVSSQPVTAYITLTPQENGTISFVVSGDATIAYVQGSAGVRGSSAQEEKNTELVYCQGTAELHVENTVRSTSQSLDLTAVLARCQPQWGEPTAYAAECYRQYRSLGFNYGPSFKGIEQLSRGEDEVLARFRLPEVVAQTWTEGGCRDGACLHPPLYIPLWDRVSLPQPAEAPVRLSEEPCTPMAQGTQATISGDTTKQVVIVGGTPDEQGTITQVYPSARILEVPAGASIERLAQHLQELGAIGTRMGTVGTRL